jgi:GH15 family glucan-1,4-alpha-glucosidase
MTAAADEPSPYPDIGAYAFVGDGHAGALVGPGGSVDWCCLPRLDVSSVFGRILDWDHGGHYAVRPDDPGAESTRRYVDDTMVLETTWRAAGGEARVVDLFTVHEGGATDPYRQLLRVIEGTGGRLTFAVRLAARFDYGTVKPWLRDHGHGLWSVVGGDTALVVSGDVDLAADGVHDLAGTVTVAEGDRARISLVVAHPERIDPEPGDPPGPDELDRRLDETLDWWRSWAARTDLDGPLAAGARRSALVLKALVNAPTGALAAAATTSLPEAIGAGRNWDYRYCWVRDSQFAVRSLAEVGHAGEADGLRRFVERSAAGDADEVQIAFGLGGERRLSEETLSLAGYRGSAPVRVGNAAAHQRQLDVYGELLELAWRWHGRGASPDNDYWRFLAGLVECAADRWDEPDCGIWELRGEPRHFVHSKAMCWVALDRGVRLAEECGLKGPLDRWRDERGRVRASIDRHGVDRERGCFVQAYGSASVDAALLLLPTVGYVDYDDPVMCRTVAAIVEDLDDGRGLLRSYRNDDGLDGDEGAFVACTFWLAECLAGQGDRAGAQAAFDRAAATASDLGLFAEQYDPAHHAALGNYPQALSHLSHISAAVTLTGHTTGN